MTRTISLLVTILMVSCIADDQRISKIDKDVRLIRITEESFGLSDGPGSTLIAEVKGDTPEARAFVDALWKEHRASFPKEQRIHYGPDSSFTQIELVRGSARIVVGSWHTVEETSPELFASHSGLRVLGDRTREEALAAEPEAYRRFRASFNAILAAVADRKKPVTRALPPLCSGELDPVML
jgi:hypothetical protein